MSFLRMTFNDYGTPVSQHRCDSCGDVFTVCPGPEEGESGEEFDKRFGGCCLAETCGSYSLPRDVDLFFDYLPIMAEGGQG